MNNLSLNQYNFIKFVSYIKKQANESPTIIEIINNNFEHKNVILQQTTITSVLVDVIIEYCSDILPIQVRTEESDQVTITFDNIFEITICPTPRYIILINNSLQQSMSCRFSSPIPDINTVINIKNSLAYVGLTNINIFINHYMKKYHNYDKYIKNIESLDEEENKYCGINNNIFFQRIEHSGSSNRFKIITVLDSKHVLLMINIIKLFIDLLEQIKKLIIRTC